MRLYIFKNSIRLGSSYFYLFIIYYFQVQNVFILIFTLNCRVTIKSVMLEGIANMNIFLLVLFMTQIQCTVFPFVVSPFWGRKYSICVWSCFWFFEWASILSVNDDYNNNMNSFDIINQLCNQYWINNWMKKYNWRWELFWWSHGVFVVNSYVIYKN